MKLRRDAACLLSLTVLFTAAACSGDKFGTRTQTWNEVGDSDYQQAADEPQAERRLTAREYATRFATTGECEIEARRMEATNPKAGLALFTACLERADFRELEPFYSRPWRQHLEDEEGRIAAGRVIAQRGGWVGEDLATLQSQDIDVLTLAQAMEQPEQARKKTLIARLRFLEPRKGVPGQLVFEEATLSPIDIDEEELAATSDSRFPTTLTGQRAILELPEAKRPPRAGDELVVVAELLGIERVLNAEAVEEEEWAVLRVLAHFPPELRDRL